MLQCLQESAWFFSNKCWISSYAFSLQFLRKPVNKAARQMSYSVKVVDYNPQWAGIFARERDLILSKISDHFVEFEHIGSTAVPGQRAKPVVDMMVAVHSLGELDAFLPRLAHLGYQLIETGMRDRYFLRKEDEGCKQIFHLHIVELSTWTERNERLMRDYLREHPAAVKAYGELKTNLANIYSKDSLAYTKAKTSFIQGIVDKARDSLGLAQVSVWED